MKLEDIHIGDVVRIRQYEDMVREFGEDEFLGRKCVRVPAFFKEEMSFLSGQTFTVSKITGAEQIISSEDNVGGYIITADMLEPAEQIESTTDEPYEYIDISAFLER